MQFIPALLLALGLAWAFRQWQKTGRLSGLPAAVLALALVASLAAGRTQMLVVLAITAAVFWRPLSQLLLSSRSGNAASQRPVENSMSVEEAREVLGVGAGANREEVINAHRRLMQKLHPDRGGSDYLAARVNEAKAVLLGKGAR